MRSVQNIQKITKAMKMVSAAKLKHDTIRMEKGLPFAAPVQRLFERLPRGADPAGSVALLALTSDKGLCGGVNTAVSKQTRLKANNEEAKGNPVKIMFVGQKGPGVLKRLYGDRFTHSFEEVTKVPFNFATASIIAERVIVADPVRMNIFYNHYKNVGTYETQNQAVVTKGETKLMEKLEWSKAMDVYSFEPALYEVFDDLHEFYYGSVVFGCYCENLAVEQSQRMAAMENASKNAGEMLAKLSLQYNRARQAKITTELCEIISGASAV